MIFIVGYSRSGTKMLNRILDSEKIADKVPEIHFFEQLYQFGKNNQKIDLDVLIERLINILERGGQKLENGILVSDVEEALRKFIESKNKNKPEVIDVYKKFVSIINKHQPVDPTPRNAYYITEIAKIIPESKFIYMIRDPRDCILSQSVKWRNYFYNKERPFEAMRLKLNYNPSLMAKFWKNSLLELEKAKTEGIENRLLLLKYEEITETPKSAVSKIRSFLGKNETPQSNLGFIRSGNSHKWKSEFSSSELYLIESVLTEELQKFDYEVSDFSFFDKLKGNLLGAIYWLKLPFAFLLNLSRINNPWFIFKKRILNR